MREITVEDYLRRRVHEREGETRKVKWLDRRGAPDRLVLLPGHAPALVELKAPGAKPESHQLREHERLRRFGFTVAVIDSKEGVDKWLQ